jgi:hypothetical protein
LQSDLNTIRSEYEQTKANYKELKKQNHILLTNQQHIQHQHQHHLIHSNSNTLNLSADMLKSPNTKSNTHQTNSNSANTSMTNLNQENENLEEDMRKAKESADMLRSVVLPLETEITTLRQRSDTSDKRIRELENELELKNKELEQIRKEERNLVEELLKNNLGENENEDQENVKKNVYFKRFVQLKKYLKTNETKFIQLEQAHLKSIKNVYSVLTAEQKLRLLRML